MIRLSPEAERHVDALIAYYEATGREQASVNLLKDLLHARARIETHSERGIPAPRPYPALARPGRLWIIEGRYWIAYQVAEPPVIVGVFYVTADIPNRI